MISSVEPLENRIAPAGVVTFTADEIGLLLIGDNADNDLAITQSGNEITLTPRNGTLILNELAGEGVPSGDPVTFLIGEENLLINMGQGSDVLSLTALSFASNLDVLMGEDLDETEDTDQLTIVDLYVGGDFFVRSDAGTVQITGERFRTGFDATFVSVAAAFTVDVEGFYIGDDLTVDATIGDETDRFLLAALDLVVYDDLTISASIYDEEAPANAVSIDVADGLFNVGGSLFVLNNSFGRSSIQIEAANAVLSGKVIVENQSNDTSETLSLEIEADTLRLDGGLTFTSNSPASSSVDLSGDLVLIDGPVVAKLTKSAGSLSIESNVLQIESNVSFFSKGSGSLQLAGAGDIFGKVAVSLAGGTGEVAISGTDRGALNFDGLSVITPVKLPASGTGVNVSLEDVVLFGKVSLLLGRGVDTVDIDDSVFRSAVTISTGDGADKVNIHTAGNSVSQFRSGVGVNLGAGDDELTLGSIGEFDQRTALLIYGPAVLNGGTGSDTFTSDDRNLRFFKSFKRPTEVLPIPRAFEVVS